MFSSVCEASGPTTPPTGKATATTIRKMLAGPHGGVWNQDQPRAWPS